MVYQLIEKIKFYELKDILRLRGLRVSWEKSELVARVFVAKKQYISAQSLFHVFTPIIFAGETVYLNIIHTQLHVIN